MENVRYNITPCTPQEAAGYISKIDESVYVPRNIVKADERSHYDRYTYVKNDCRVAVVYDTFAQVISITGSKQHADELMDLFGIDDSKTVKTSTVPAQGSQNKTQTPIAVQDQDGRRAKLFMDPKAVRRNDGITPITVIATAKGAELSTDEIYPPQRAKKRTDLPKQDQPARQPVVSAPQFDVQTKPQYGQGGIGMTISANTARTGAPRRATISFGDEDDYDKKRDSSQRQAVRPTGTGIFAEIATAPAAFDKPDKTDRAGQPEKPDDNAQPAQATRKRGRPPKNKQQNAIGGEQNVQQSAAQQNVRQGQEQQARRRGRPPKINQTQQGALVTAPGYTVKPTTPEPTEQMMQFSKQNMADLLSRLKKSGKLNVAPNNTNEDEIAFIVSDRSGQKVSVSFVEKRVTLRIFGIYGELFKTVKTHAEKLRAKNPVVVITPQRPTPQRVDVSSLSEPMRRLYNRIPTAFVYLSEQSRTEFMNGMQDLSQSKLNISDYSGLLVQPFRALEKFIFDLQHAEGIHVKMIGQAYDKDEQGKYILKRGYQQRIGKVVYAEVMVALYTEYFTQRNFFAHSDNTDGKTTRSLSDRTAASKIFEHILDVVEYNSRKLKETGFSMEPGI